MRDSESPVPKLQDHIRSALSRLGMVLGRSFFPLVALVIVLGTVLWGPWVSLLLAGTFWYVIDKLEKMM